MKKNCASLLVLVGSALGLAAVSLSAQAQAVYRCGSTYSQHPCAVQSNAVVDERPMLRDNESMEQFAERQLRFLEERKRFSPTRVATGGGPSSNDKHPAR